MNTDTRSTDDIERDINHERAKMTGTINDLQQKFSVDAIMNDIGSMFRIQGGEFGRSVGDRLGRHPAAVVLVGVGLAWMFLGPDGDAAERPSGKRNVNGQGRNRPSFDPWDDRGERYGRSADYAFNDDDHHWYGSGRMSGGGHREAPSLTDDKDDGPGLAGTIRQTASSMGEAVSDTASDLMDRLSHGLGNLSDDARDRVIAARRAAHEARQSSQAMIDRGAQGAAGFFEEQPLVVGALAMALGAALGGALPHSRIEDRTMGESSDRLFAKAQTLLQEEREKAERMMKTAAADLKDEVRDIGDDIAELVPEGKTAGEAIVDRAAASASRIVENATGGSDDHKRGQTQS